MVARAFALAAAALLLGGCGGDGRLPALSAGSVVLCFGDSLTAGVGAGEEESYPSVLATLLGCEVVNAGVPGEVSEEGLDRLAALLARHRPALVVLCHGGNDMLRRLDDAATARNIDAMIAQAREAGAGVILLGVPRPGIFLKAPAFYAEAAKASGAVYEGKIVPSVLSSGALKSDPIHPNAAGYRKMAERVAALVRVRS